MKSSTFDPGLILCKTTSNDVVVNDFYACFHMVSVTVVTLSQVNFVPRDRTSSCMAAVLIRQTRSPKGDLCQHLIVAKLLPRCHISVSIKK
jgi:hypothetical protein